MERVDVLDFRKLEVVIFNHLTRLMLLYRHVCNVSCVIVL